MQQNLVREQTHTKHIGQTGAFLGFWFGGFGLIVVGAVAAAENEDFGLGLIVLGIIALLVGIICFTVLLYQVWRFVINESRRNNLVPSIGTPGKAVGYCFIPFFNLYWFFRAYGRFPKDLNALACAKVSSQRMPEELGTAIAAMGLVSFIPVIGFFAAIVSIILHPIFITRAVHLCKELGAIREAQSRSLRIVFHNDPRTPPEPAVIASGGHHGFNVTDTGIPNRCPYCHTQNQVSKSRLGRGQYQCLACGYTW